MSGLKEYTLEIYKSDRRMKEGRRLICKTEYAESTVAYISAVAESKRKLGFIVEIFETWIEKKNLMTGKTFMEKYDTPYYCSPASESYYSF